jgi:ectoine hydroxylase-related dioxygenase (phytanoyl-CoA dioxygenase family)
MQGSSAALTVWLPLVDCPLDLGPLAVAEGSHLLGRRPYLAVRGARVLPCDASDLTGAWSTATFCAGDALVFHCMSVHRALPNLTGSVRLSVDFRCQAASEPVCELTVREDPTQTWDDLYATLPERSPAMAWRRLPLRLVPFDRTVLAPS